MPRFRRLWRCSVCGKPLADGGLLDCSECSDWLFAQIIAEHDRKKGVEWAPRIRAVVLARPDSDEFAAAVMERLEEITR